MLKLEISLPDKCHDRSKVIDICSEFEHDTVYIRIRLCAHCAAPYVKVRRNQRLCHKKSCRASFYRDVAHCAASEPSIR